MKGTKTNWDFYQTEPKPKFKKKEFGSVNRTSNSENKYFGLINQTPNFLNQDFGSVNRAPNFLEQDSS